VDGGKGPTVGDDEGLGFGFVADLSEEGRVVGTVESVVLELRIGCCEGEVDRQFECADGSGGCCLTDLDGGGRDRAEGEDSRNSDDKTVHFDFWGLALEIPVFKD
jgi:hypothetical protein